MTPQLLKLLAKNKGKGYFKAEANGDTATLYVYDAIVSDPFWGGITALDFVKELAAITAPSIDLRINCPGGDVFAARAMAQALKEHPSQITAHVDGYAASAATFLVIAADTAVISDGAMFMIHNAWTMAAGDAKDFADMSALLSRTDQTIINDYMAKTGATEEQIKAWMDAETYFYGQEAVDAGFVTALAATAPKNAIDWDLSAYAKAPLKEPEPDNNLLQQNQNRLRVMQALIPH